MDPVEKIKSQFNSKIKDQWVESNVVVFVLDKTNLLDFVSFVKNDKELDLNMLTDVSAVDYLTWNGKAKKDKRFEVVYHLLSLENDVRIRVKVPLADGESIPSLTPYYQGANWAERECFDLMGIRFEGHPDLRRIIMPDKYPGNPLRKDHPQNPEGLEDLLIPDILLKNEVPEVYDENEPSDDELVRTGVSVSREEGDYTILNLGPSHPATHGILQNILKLDGETIIETDVTIGFVHRCFEKLAEAYTYNQFLVCTDRMNYVSSPMNNIGWVVAIEEMLKIDVPARAQYIRVIINELTRISDHLVCLGIMGVDLGAFTPFLLLYHQREKIYTIYEKLVGARITTTFSRVGGLELDLYDGFVNDVKDLLKSIVPILKDCDNLLTRNRIFVDRTLHVGAISAEKAVSYGFTGPNLRAAGVPYDVRKFRNYLSYKDFEFDVPVGEDGSVYYRYLVRFEEIRQSMRIVEQALNNIPEGPIKARAPEIIIADKKDIYSKMDSLIFHFQIMQRGFAVPEGEHYSSTEVANGELGFYIVSEGKEMPYRVRVRRPCFYYYQSFPELVKGGMIADAIANMSSLNVIAGELDG